MLQLILAIHIVIAIVMIGLILIQHGKGADAGASFGAGGAATVFGAGGSATFLTKLTTILAGLFFVTSLLLAASARREAADQLRLDIPTPPPVQQSPTASVAPTSSAAALSDGGTKTATDTQPTTTDVSTAPVTTNN